MAVVNQLNLNVGTEQNPNFVLHDINDKRISTTAVTTATHLLSCNSGVTSIAPITAENLASVLGVRRYYVSNAPQGTAIEIDNARLGLLYVAEGSNGLAGLYLVSYNRVYPIYPEATEIWSVVKDSTTRTVTVTRTKSGTGNLDCLYVNCRK